MAQRRLALALALSIVGGVVAPHNAHAQNVRYMTLGTWDNYCVLARRDTYNQYGYRGDGLTDETITYSSDNNPSGGQDAAHQACNAALNTTQDHLAYGGTSPSFVYYTPQSDRTDYIACDTILGYDGNWRETWMDNRKIIHGTYVGNDGQTYTVDQGYLQIAVRDDASSQTGQLDCSSFIGLQPQIYPNGTTSCNCGGGGGSGDSGPSASPLTLPRTPKVKAPHKGKPTSHSKPAPHKKPMPKR